jgi:peptidoglycan hydrolase-like protein with peptidoglycan-binding domain
LTWILLSLSFGGGNVSAAEFNPRVKEVQQMLGELGYDVGVADGFFGARTSESIRWFQKDYGLLVDGRYSEALLAQLRLRLVDARRQGGPAFSSADASAGEVNPRVKEVQQILGEIGYDAGKADGRLGARTHRSIRSYQRDHGLTVDGQYSDELLAQLKLRLAEARQAGGLVFNDVQAHGVDLDPGVKQAQQMLGELGYDAGRPDGLLGVRTHRSIRSFQRDHGLAIDGQYSEALLAQLKSRLANVRQKRGMAVDGVRASAVGFNPRIKELQQMLGELGYNVGRADGLLGAETHKSISAFQRDHGIEIDGQYSEALLAQLRSRLADVRREGNPVLADAQAPSGRFNPGVKELQRLLGELGYDAGEPDGLFGARTSSSIRAYQIDNGLAVNGRYSDDLLSHLKLQLGGPPLNTASEGQKEFEAPVEAASDLQKESETTQELSPEEQQTNEKRRQLLAMSNEQLIVLIERSDKQEVGKILELLGDRTKQLPFRILSILRDGELDGETLSLLISLGLISLQYPGTTDGVIQFQQDLGAEPTGEITVGQWEELTRRRTRFFDTHVYVASADKLYISATDGYASVEGTWIIEGDQIAYPINKGKVECRHDRGECQLIQAELSVPGVSEDKNAYLLGVSSDLYKIIAWTDDEVVAQKRDECRTVILTLNLDSNEVYKVAQNNGTNACPVGSLAPANFGSSGISRLVPSWNETYNFWQKRKDVVKDYANPRITRKFKELAESGNAKRQQANAPGDALKPDLR